MFYLARSFTHVFYAHCNSADRSTSSAVVVFELKINDANLSVAVKMRGMGNISFLWLIEMHS